jgi:hypothetical protein
MSGKWDAGSEKKAYPAKETFLPLRTLKQHA